MIIAVVTMNIVYLVDESRATYGEKGINDPPVKLAITLLTFALLAGLQKYGVADPSILSAGNTTDTTVEEAYTNVNLRLRGQRLIYCSLTAITTSITMCCFSRRLRNHGHV